MSTNFNKRTLVCGCLFALLSLSEAHAQVGTQKWNFQNREQGEQATAKNFENLRVSYDIIVCARRHGMIKSVLKVYEQKMGKDPFGVSMKVASSYSLGFSMAYDSTRWDWKPDYAKIPVRGPREGMQVTLYRDRSLQALPHSPEVLLGYAFYRVSCGTKFQGLSYAIRDCGRDARGPLLNDLTAP